MTERPLGRREPTDDRHVRLFRLTTATLPDKPTPVIAGSNWYSSFDEPQWDRRGRFWMIGAGALGYVRGGHAWTLKPDGITDTVAWWDWFDQGEEGACVGFAIGRALTLLNRTRYHNRDIYRAAQAIDEFDDTPPEEGTSVRAGLDVVRTTGPCRVFRGRTYPPDPAAGILSNRWATSVEDAVAAMHSPRYLELGRACFLNSWGRTGYPHITWMPLDTLDRLLREDGELAVIIDR